MNEKFNIYDGCPISLDDLIKWANDQKAKGNTHFETEISWDYYNDIDDVELQAIKKDK